MAPPPPLAIIAATALLLAAALLLVVLLLHVRSVLLARRARARARDADVLSGMRVGAATPPPKVVRALTEDQLASAAPVAQAGGDGDACAVCLEEMGEGKLRRIRVCGHLFHSACLRGWVRKDGSCPCCRERLVRGGEVDGIAVIRRAQLAIREGRGRLGEPRGRGLPPGGVILTAKTWDVASSGGGSVCDEDDEDGGAATF